MTMTIEQAYLRVKKAAGRDESRPAMRGVLVCDGLMYATDGHRMHIAPVERDGRKDGCAYGADFEGEPPKALTAGALKVDGAPPGFPMVSQLQQVTPPRMSCDHHRIEVGYASVETLLPQLRELKKQLDAKYKHELMEWRVEREHLQLAHQVAQGKTPRVAAKKNLDAHDRQRPQRQKRVELRMNGAEIELQVMPACRVAGDRDKWVGVNVDYLMDAVRAVSGGRRKGVDLRIQTSSCGREPIRIETAGAASSGAPDVLAVIMPMK